MCVANCQGISKARSLVSLPPWAEIQQFFCTAAVDHLCFLSRLILVQELQDFPLGAVTTCLVK